MTRPCTANPAPFDRLIDLHTIGNKLSREARVSAIEARRICAGCEIRDACWTENAVESWVDAMKRAPRKPRDKEVKPPPVPCSECGKEVRNNSGVCRPCREASKTFDADDPRHGTQPGYTQHKKRGEEPCGPCREGWTQYHRESRARRRAAQAEREKRRAAAEAASARAGEWVA